MIVEKPAGTHGTAALAPDVHKTPSAVPPHKTKKDECRSIQVYALTSVVDEDDQDCGGDAKTIKDHGGDNNNNNEDNQDDHGGDDDDTKTITVAATTAKTIKTVATRRRSGTTAAAATTTQRQSRRRRRREGDHGDNDNDAKAITAAVTTATTIKTAAATQRQPQQQRRKDDAKTITVARAKTITTAAAGRAIKLIQNPSTPETPNLYPREPVPKPARTGTVVVVGLSCRGCHSEIAANESANPQQTKPEITERCRKGGFPQEGTITNSIRGSWLAQGLPAHQSLATSGLRSHDRDDNGSDGGAHDNSSGSSDPPPPMQPRALQTMTNDKTNNNDGAATAKQKTLPMPPRAERLKLPTTTSALPTQG
ncbi:hypothetical protein EDB85DRAFT_1904913 [Lactarius pseudohatsudake]|nr:hypothetical protein EDB85DRAFT_1904913 [Lactarius pseudohatsudake]